MTTAIPLQLMVIPSGTQGTCATLKKMKSLVKDFIPNYPIIELSRHLVANLDQKDFFGEARLIQEFVRDQIRYVKDPRGCETIATPLMTLRIGQGDCDDKSILVSTMLEQLGVKTKLVALAFNNMPHFSHVYVEAFLNREWVGIETTEPVDIGWKPKNITERLEVVI